MTSPHRRHHRLSERARQRNENGDPFKAREVSTAKTNRERESRVIAQGAERGKEVLKPWVSNGILSPLSFAAERKWPCGAKNTDKQSNLQITNHSLRGHTFVISDKSMQKRRLTPAVLRIPSRVPHTERLYCIAAREKRLPCRLLAHRMAVSVA